MTHRSLSLAAVALAILIGAGAAVGQETPVRIGLIDMYNGPFAYQTGQIRLGFQIAIDEANAAGGVKGRKFELQTADMGLSVEKAITEARRMISNDGIHYVVVGSHAGAALAIGGLIKGRDDVFLLGGVATSKHFTAEVGGPMIGRSNWSTVELGRIMAANIKSKQEIKRIATIAPDFEFGHDFVDDIVAAIKQVRPDIVIARQEWPKIGTLDFAPQVTAIQAAKPDMVVSGIFGGDLVNFLKAAKGFGLFEGGKVKFFTHGLDQVKMAFAKDSLPEGTLVNLWYPYYAIKSPESTKFVAEVEKRSKDYPVGSTLVGYIAGKMLTTAIVNGGDPDHAVAASKAMAGMSFSTPVGMAHVRGCDNVAAYPYFFGTVKRGSEFPDGIGAVGIQAYDPAQYARTCAEVLKLRKN
jgi:branched-chain amino acid transport system substrate-binding protein